jgi:tryptophan synthase beta chain
MNSKVFLPAAPGESPDSDGYFGTFGGKFIPEALVAAVDEVAVEYERAKADPEFAAELGRPA